MGRRRGELEEQLRAAVTVYVRGTEARAQSGRNKQIAELIGRPASWVTEYINGDNHASLDTSVALMKVIGWTVRDDLSGLAAPSVPPELLEALRDEEIRGLVEDLARLQDQPAVRRDLIAMVRAVAQMRAPRPSAPARESSHAPPAGGHTRRARSQRR